MRFCRSGVTRDQLASILRQETLFAENVIEQLAEALDIDRGRAIADYRHGSPGGGPPGPPGPGGASCASVTGDISIALINIVTTCFRLRFMRSPAW